MSRRVPGRALRLAAVPLALLLTLVATRSARSFVAIVDTSGNFFHWRIDPVHWEENSGGEESMTGESAEVQAAFDSWEDLVEATVNFTNDGTVGSNSCGSDGVNRICYNDPAGDQGPGVLATTYSSYSGPIVVKMGDSFGRIVEADIAFNNGVDFTTNAGAGAGCFGEVDIRGVVAHEIGHFIGLDHSSAPGATMAPAIGDCDPGAASLSSDDIDGAAFLYPSGIGSPPPVAEFTASPTTGPATLAVSFSDLSTGTVATWAWNFGDGGTSALPNPSHNYVAPGAYTVSLTVTGIAGSDAETKTGYINVTPGTAGINSDFSGTPRMGNAPLTVTFSDLTTPSATGWSWDFGAAGTSALQNPTVVFAAPGSYDVSLGVTNGAATDVELKTGYVDVMAGTGPAVADFSGAPTRGLAPMSVVFTDLSSGAIDTWSWNFGDGIGSTSTSPTHVFSAPGLYTVALTVSGPGGSSTETKTSYIEVLEPGGGPVADFVADPLQGTAPFRASFSDYSTGEIDQRVWNFGEGDVIIESTEFAAMFPEPGYYDIALTVSGAGGSDTLLKENYIVVLNPDGTLPPNPDATTGIGNCSCRVVGVGDNHDSSTAGLLVVGLGLLTSTAGLRRRRRR
jgi:PKD repeat protein